MIIFWVGVPYLKSEEDYFSLYHTAKDPTRNFCLGLTSFLKGPYYMLYVLHCQCSTLLLLLLYHWDSMRQV
jgi:hypothetical protein